MRWERLFGPAAEPCMDKEELDGKGVVTVKGWGEVVGIWGWHLGLALPSPLPGSLQRRVVV